MKHIIFYESMSIYPANEQYCSNHERGLVNLINKMPRTAKQ